MNNYTVMIPIHTIAKDPYDALMRAIELLNPPFNDGYVTEREYTIGDMADAGFTYVHIDDEGEALRKVKGE